MSLNFSFRYIDDVLSLNNLQFKDYLHQIYPSELEFKETTDTPALASYLDLYLYIDNSGRLKSKLYDKHDDFDFPIVNFPFLSSNIPTSPAYGVYISQLIRYCRACTCTVMFSTERNYRLKNYYARVMFSHCWYRHSRSFTVVIMIWGLTSFNRFWVYYRIDTHTDFDFIPDFPLALWRRPHAEQIMPTLPEYLMIFPVFVKFTLLVFYVCGVRVQSCLFVLSLLFLLSLFVQSLYCHIFGTMMFWIIRLVASVFVCRCLYNILLYLDQIALSMFHQ